MNKYLITGATGFIGANLVRALIKRGEDISILSRTKDLNWRLKDIESGLRIYVCDLLDADLPQIVKTIKPTHIFHLAAYGSLPSDNNIEKMVYTNLLGTIRLLSAVKKYPFKLFVNTGSTSEYGIKNHPMAEDDLLKPVNDYGITKAASTLYCQRVAIQENLPIVTFRLFSVYGSYEEKTRLIPSIIFPAIHNKDIYLSSPHPVRDFTYIGDVVSAYFQAEKVTISPGDVINIAAGAQHNIKEVTDIVLSQTSSVSKIHWGKIKPQERQVEMKQWQADVSKAKKTLSWKANHNISQGIEDTINWFKKNSYLYE